MTPRESLTKDVHPQLNRPGCAASSARARPSAIASGSVVSEGGCNEPMFLSSVCVCVCWGTDASLSLPPPALRGSPLAARADRATQSSTRVTFMTRVDGGPRRQPESTEDTSVTDLLLNPRHVAWRTSAAAAECTSRILHQPESPCLSLPTPRPSPGGVGEGHPPHTGPAMPSNRAPPACPARRRVSRHERLAAGRTGARGGVPRAALLPAARRRRAPGPPRPDPRPRPTGDRLAPGCPKAPAGPGVSDPGAGPPSRLARAASPGRRFPRTGAAYKALAGASQRHRRSGGGRERAGARARGRACPQPG